jgi:hypothetical protein
MNQLTEINDEIFAMVARELAAGRRDEALWTKAFALQNGNESATKAHYIRLRAEQISRSSEAEARAKQSTGSSDRDAIATRWSLGKIILLVLGSLVVMGVVKATFFRESEMIAPVTAPASLEKKGAAAPQEATGPILINALSGVTLDQGVPIEGGHRIDLHGTITELMADEFVRVLHEIRARAGKENPFRIYLDSKGGDVYAAMKIGRAIRGDPNNAVGVLRPSECLSSCVFILAGGDQRLRWGTIGIHRPYLVTPTSDDAALKRWFEKLSIDAKTYLREMNVKEALFDDMVAIPPENVRIFNSEQEMDHYGLLQLDPVTDEKITSLQMRNYGIATKSEFYERKRKLNQECNNLPTDQFASCYNKIMSGG